MLLSRTSVISFSIMKPSLHDIFVRIAGPGGLKRRKVGKVASPLRKILLIAKRDYVAVVMRRAFLIGLVVAPLLFGGGFLGIALLRVGARDRRVALVDRTGTAASAVIDAARNRRAEDLAPGKSAPQMIVSGYVFEAVPLGSRCGRAADRAFGPRSPWGAVRIHRNRTRQDLLLHRLRKARLHGNGWPARWITDSGGRVSPNLEVDPSHVRRGAAIRVPMENMATPGFQGTGFRTPRGAIRSKGYGSSHSLCCFS